VFIRPLDWGADAGTYIAMYKSVNSGAVSSIEPSFTVLSKIVFALGNCVKMLFVFYGIISLGLKIKVIENESYYPLVSLLIYFSSWFVLHELFQIRVGASVAFMYFSIPFLLKKEYFKFFVTAILAVFFHTQAILIFLFLMIPKRKISAVSICVISLCILFAYSVYFLHIDFMKEILKILVKINFPRINQIKWYYEIESKKIINLGKINAFSPIVLVRLFLTLVLLFNYKRLNSVSYYPFLVRVVLFSFFVRMICWPVAVIGMRIYEFFTCLDVFIFPLFFKIIREKKIVFFLLVCYCIFNLYV
jgi:hypothetical protein